jgi:enoyl-CoA hydratase/carnithine racemase
MGEVEVRCEVAAQRAVLTIDRPQVRNALGADTIVELLAALERADADPEVRAIVLTGAGEKVFCAGGDLSSMAPPDGFLSGHEGRARYGQLLTALSRTAKPTVARVNGHAMAGGLGLVLGCDFAVMAEEAELGLPEVDRGLFPMMVTALLQRHLGRKRALELLLLGGRINAATALAWGLCNRTAPRAGLDAAVEALTAQLVNKSPAVMRLGRRAYFAAEDLALGQALEHLNAQLSMNLMLEDAAEGVSAFLQKRAPDWKGK